MWDISTIRIQKLVSALASAAMCSHVERIPWFSLGFLFLLLSYFTIEKNSGFRKDMFHTLCLQQHICNTGSDIVCLINFSKRLSLNLDEVSIKIQISCSNQLHLTCRLKGPWSLLPFFLAHYKNNFGYKCLHSTNFISKAASLLSHPNKYVSTHAQKVFLIYFCSGTLEEQ